MRGYIALSCLSLLLHCVLANTSESICLSKNKFLADMSKAEPLPVYLKSSPMKTRRLSTTCAPEWNTHGTCCQLLSIEPFYELETAMIDLNHKYLVRKVTSAARALGAEADFAHFEQQSAACWGHMKRVRGAALCALCSGRSEVFVKHDKALVTKDLCVQTVEHCEGFFLAVADVARKLKAQTNVQVKMTKAERREVEQIRVELQKYRPPQHLVDAFLAYRKSKKDPKLAGLEANKVCSMVLNVRKAPYLMVMNKEGIMRFQSIVEKKLDAQMNILITKINNKYANNIKLLDQKVEQGLFKIDSAAYTKEKKLIEAQKTEMLKQIEDDFKERQEKLEKRAEKIHSNWRDPNKAPTKRRPRILRDSSHGFDFSDHNSLEQSNHFETYFEEMEMQSDTMVFDEEFEHEHECGVLQHKNYAPMNDSLTFVF